MRGRECGLRARAKDARTVTKCRARDDGDDDPQQRFPRRCRMVSANGRPRGHGAPRRRDAGRPVGVPGCGHERLPGPVASRRVRVRQAGQVLHRPATQERAGRGPVRDRGQDARRHPPVPRDLHVEQRPAPAGWQAAGESPHYRPGLDPAAARGRVRARATVRPSAQGEPVSHRAGVAPAFCAGRQRGGDALHAGAGGHGQRGRGRRCDRPLRHRRAGRCDPPPQRGTGNDGAATAPDLRASGPRWPGPDHQVTDHPSFPGGSYPGAASTGPGRRHPDPPLTDHPSFPGGSYPGAPSPDPYFTDHPSFPGADPRYPGARRPGARRPGADHSSWPGGAGGPAGPRRQASPEPHNGHPSRAASPQAAGARTAAGIWGPPDAPPGGATDRTQQQSTQVARTAGAATQAYQDVAFGDGRLQVILTGTPAVGWAGATGLDARPEDLVQLAGGQTAQLADAIRRDVGEFQHAHSLWLAGRILSGAESQAAEIRQEAYEQAAALRAAAEREAAEARQQAAAMRATAEAEAADLLTSARTMSSELGRVAAYVTENLTSPGLPITRPAARPEAMPGSEPTVRPEARPTRPATEPTARPGARPSARRAARSATKPNGRQVKALRKVVIALMAVFLVGAVSGTTEIALHGFSFFVFRNAGAGAGNSRNLEENQGPGQRDAPR